MNGYLRNITSSLSTAAKTFQDRYTQGRQYRFGDIVVEEMALIAEGGFGFIYLCRDVQTDTQYVVKKLNCQDKERLGLAMREVEVYERIGTQNHIVRYYGHLVEQIDFRAKEVNLLFEFLPNGHILDLLNRNSGLLAEREIVSILLDVAKGLTHLHKLNIQNRDIKIENILQAADGRWVLVDLGSWSDKAIKPREISKADLVAVEDQVERFTTMMYRSPEMVDMYKGCVIGTASDMWMLGCVLFTLMHNKHPFQDESKLAIANARFHLDPAVFTRFSHALIDLLFWLLAEDPEHRPTAPQLVDVLDTWFTTKSGLALPSPVVERAQKVFRIHGVARQSTDTPAPRPAVAAVPSAAPGWADFDNFLTAAGPQTIPASAQAPAVADDNWANFDAVEAPEEVGWTADFDAFPEAATNAGSTKVNKPDDLLDLLG